VIAACWFMKITNCLAPDTRIHRRKYFSWRQHNTGSWCQRKVISAIQIEIAMFLRHHWCIRRRNWATFRFIRQTFSGHPVNPPTVPLRTVPHSLTKVPLRYWFNYRLESPTRQLEMTAAKDINLQSRAGGIEVVALEDVKFRALDGSVSMIKG